MVLYGNNVAGFATQSTPQINTGTIFATNNNLYLSSYESTAYTDGVNFLSGAAGSNALKSYFYDVDGDLNTTGDRTIGDAVALGGTGDLGMYQYRFRAARFF